MSVDMPLHCLVNISKDRFPENSDFRKASTGSDRATASLQSARNSELLIRIDTLPIFDYLFSGMQCGHSAFYRKIYAGMSMQSNRLISGYLGVNPTPWSSAGGIFYAMPSFIKLMTGLTMTLPIADLQKLLPKSLVSPEEINALLYGIFPISECSADSSTAFSTETVGGLPPGRSLQNTSHKVALLASGAV